MSFFHFILRQIYDKDFVDQIILWIKCIVKCKSPSFMTIMLKVSENNMNIYYVLALA